MTNIRIEKLALENFKCHRWLELEFGGENATIYGDNAAGKTSVYDAFAWLLYGKDCRGGSPQVRPVNDAGEVADREAVTAVEAVLRVNGERLRLRRVRFDDLYDYYERLGFDFRKESYDDIANEWIPEYRRLEREAPLRTGALDLLTAFWAHKIPQVVLSASETGILHEQLDHLQILHFFWKIYGRGDYHGSEKTELALSIAREYPTVRVLLIGDTDHDAACAKAAGFDCVLMAGGHQSTERLAACGCPIFEAYSELAAHLAAKGAL
jgi:phosphoglycolate phosphatase